MKYVVIVPDGMADYPIEELSNKTPLEAGRTINMDFIAKNGFSGLVNTIPPKLMPGSDIGNLSLLGYDPAKYFTGRAPLEAANLDIDLADDEVVFRCNLVTVMGDKMEDYSAGHISSKEASVLIDSLNEEIGEKDIRFVAGKSYRHLMILKVRNPQEYLQIKCFPPHDIMDENIKNHLPQGQHSQVLLKLMEKGKKILANHEINNVRLDLKENPANLIWFWGQGVKFSLPSFYEKFGVKGSIISAVDLVNGLGKIVGFNVIKVPGITGYYDTNYLGKAEGAIEALKSRDLVYIHIEGPDEAGHNGDYKAKMSCIEKIDKYIVGTILNHFDKDDDIRILVLPDHPTPVELRTHTKDPVCFAMYGTRINQNGADNFSETEAKKMGLIFKDGEELMNYFINKFK